jgi:hypothetical protein
MTYQLLIKLPGKKQSQMSVPIDTATMNTGLKQLSNALGTKGKTATITLTKIERKRGVMPALKKVLTIKIVKH